jgi:predicted ATP-binding protein involved in virulence
MRIKSLHLRNFRAFRDDEIRFSDKKFTVLIGDNSSGKTTILDAAAVALGGYLSIFDEVAKSRHIEDDEVTVVRYETSNFERQYPVEVTCTAILARNATENDAIEQTWVRKWSKSKDHRTTDRPTYLIRHAEVLEQFVRSGVPVTLPVCGYYGTGRLWSQKNDRAADLFESGSRFLGYTDCLEPKSDEKLLAKWLKKWEMIEIQEGAEQPVLSAVREAVTTCLDSLQEDGKGRVNRISYNLKADGILVAFENGQVLPFRMLSDGYRSMIGMVADIAYRMAVLNPHLGKDAAKRTHGVVLIDEIDMHLHPKWQRSVVADLKRTFPHVQFIATTHSPFIIQSLEDGELVVLDGEFKGDYEDKSLEDVVENVMGIEMPQWSHRREEMNKAAEEYYKTLHQMKDASDEKLEELRQKLDELSKPYASNVAYYAFLEQQRLLAEADLVEEDDETR